MSDQLDANAFDATLSFVDDYVAELFAPTDGPGLTPSFSLSDATSSQLLPIGGGPVNGPSFSSSETLALPIAGQQPALVQKPQLTATKRTAAEPKKPQANPNRARNQLRFELAFLREKAVQLEQELASLKQKSPLNSSSLVAQQKPSTVLIVPQQGGRSPWTWESCYANELPSARISRIHSPKNVA
ncbi:uncharacterized protein KRP23_8354 [Phytophthora ramorum]|uniref:uncharacterized protein n=1 Tax=Phytophthora ramorum TaxID=164328 RepID=UPI00309FE923|nr:hypothetical protein KRP23_8354 [Phytophthora ramorum]